MDEPAESRRLAKAVASLLREGRYRDALDPAARAVDAVQRERGPSHPEVAARLDDLGAVYLHLRHLDAAETVFRDALTIRRTHLGPRHTDVAGSLRLVGNVRAAMGDYAGAEPLLSEALEIRRSSLPEGDPKLVPFLSRLGLVRMHAGDYPGAEPPLRMAVEIRRRTADQDDPKLAESLVSLGGIHLRMADLVAAERLFREALGIQYRALGERHSDVVTTLANLIYIYLAWGDSEAAGSLLGDAVEIVEEHDAKDHAIDLRSLASLAIDLRAYDLAADLLSRALAAQGEVLGPAHPYRAETVHDMAILHMHLGEWETAESLILEVLDVRREWLGEHHPEVAAGLRNLAAVRAATDRPAEALALMKEASSIDDGLIGQVFSIGSDRQRLSYLEHLQTSLDSLLSLVLRSLPHDPAAVAAAFDLVLRRKAIGAEALAVQRDEVLKGRHPELAERLDQLRQLRMGIAAETLSGPRERSMEEHEALLSRRHAEKEALEAELARAMPEMGLDERFGVANRWAVSAGLPTGSALIELVRFYEFEFSAVLVRGDALWKSPRYVGFVLPAGEPHRLEMVDLGEAGPIDELIASYREAITGQGRDRAVPGEESDPVGPPTTERVVGASLRAAVFDPLVAHLRHRTRVFVSPDGDLTRLPFEVLPAEDGRRLIDEYVLSYVTTGRDVLRLSPGGEMGSGTPLVAAAPDFDLHGAPSEKPPPGRRSRDLDPTRIHFDLLPGTEQEGQEIAKLLGSSALSGGQVLERVLKGSRSPRILHLATHGFFLPDQDRDPGAGMGDPIDSAEDPRPLRGAGMENPLLRSGLALAGANTFLAGGVLPGEAEDGILTAEDVSGLDLLGTEMVVLSACETGLGEIRVGEGVFGLRRAFVLAGAKTLVMSLWKVPDGPSAELMGAFYENLTKGMGRAEALREAQLAMANFYPPPWFWGAFICQGDPGPLRLDGVQAAEAG